MKTIDMISIGDKESFQKTITETDVYLFSGISGDYNPAHINALEAKKTIFKDRVVHGMLTSSLISAVLGMKLPGPGTIYLKQELKFLSPVYFGDTITAEVEVENVDYEKNRVSLITRCINQNEKMVVIGKALVKAPVK